MPKYTGGALFFGFLLYKLNFTEKLLILENLSPVNLQFIEFI